MIIDNGQPVSRRARGLLAAWLAAFALVLACVAPALGANTLARLIDPVVSQRSATSGTAVMFSVTYRNQTGADAAFVQLRLGSRTYAMAPVGSTADPRHGITYRIVVKPSVGTYAITFVTSDVKSRAATLAAGTLKISAPAPAPVTGGSSGGGSTGGTTSGGTTSGGKTSGGSTSGGTTSGGSTSGGTTSGGSTSPSGGSSSTTPTSPSPSQGGGAGAAAPSPSVAGPTMFPGAAADAALLGPVATIPLPSPAAAPTDGAVAPGRGRGGDASRSASGSGSGGFDAALASGFPGTTSAPSPAVVLGIFTTTFGGAAMAMAFLLFGKRRRDGRPNAGDDILSAAAASGLGAASNATVLEPAIAMPIPDAPLPTAAEAEMAMPRWRRPSLLEARKADPLRMASAPVAALQFEHGLVTPLEGRERRCIRYRVVRLLDRPDELTAEELGILDQGDEVQLLERSGAYWFVLCPDGRQGWVHRMVLGEAPDPGAAPGDGGDGGEGTFEWFQASLERVRAAGSPSATPPDGISASAGLSPSAGGRTERSRGGGSDPEVDADVLRAYRDSRAMG